MKIYVVAFPRIGAFAGKRGMVEEKVERAVMFWQFAEAKQWADVLGGEVRLYDEVAAEQEPLKSGDPF